MGMRARRRSILLAIIAGLLIATPAFAYIDPNTQGLITQSLTPLFVIAATIVMFFREKAAVALHWLARCISRLTNGATE
jgi:hypothetical protein